MLNLPDELPVLPAQRGTPAYPDEPPQELAASEADLLARARAGDDTAWARLVDEHLTAIWAAAGALGLPDDAAESVCELVWLRLAQRLHAAPSPLRPWLLAGVETEARRWHMGRASGASTLVVLDTVKTAG